MKRKAKIADVVVLALIAALVSDGAEVFRELLTTMIVKEVTPSNVPPRALSFTIMGKASLFELMECCIPGKSISGRRHFVYLQTFE